MGSRRDKGRAKTAALLGVALLVTGELGGARIASAAEPIRVGVIQPLSGPVAASGSFVVWGARIAADRINEHGGLLGRPLELVVEDNKSDPAEAASAAEKLITRDRVPVLLGAWGSSMTLAVMPKLRQYEVPMVVETSGASKITKQGNPWVFRIAPTNEMEAAGLEPYVKALGLRKVGFVPVNTDWGRGAAPAFGEVLKRQGVEVVGVEYVDQAATDLRAQLTKLKGAGVESLIVSTDVGQIALLLKQAAGLGMRVLVLTTGGSSAPSKLIELAGRAAQNSYHIVFFLPWFPEAMPDPGLANWFIGEWKRRGHPFEGLTEGFRGHDGITTIARAIELAGTSEPAAIQAALRKVELMGLNGPIRFDAEGQSRPTIFIVQIKDGTVVLPAFMTSVTRK